MSRANIRIAVAAVSTSIVVAVAAAPSVSAHGAPPPLTRVNVNASGDEANASSLPEVGISEDGQYVVFSSAATNLVLRFPPVTATHVYLAGPGVGVSALVSVDNNGVAPRAGVSDSPTLSAEGQIVAFRSTAVLTRADANGSTSDVYVRDRSAGTTTLVSSDASGVAGNGPSRQPMVSGDGRYVVFTSAASNLVGSDTNAAEDVFVTDLHTGSIERVSVDVDGAEGNGDSYDPAISTDGQYVVFASNATNLVFVDTNSHTDVFRVDRQIGSMERVSVHNTDPLSPDEFNGDSRHPSTSVDGSRIVFQTMARIQLGDRNNTWDVALWDRANGTWHTVSHESRSNTRTANGASERPRISANGQHVAYESSATNIVPGDTNRRRDAYGARYDGGSTDLLSMRQDLVVGNALSGHPAISASGQRIAFTTDASNLAPRDDNCVMDVLVSDHEGLARSNHGEPSPCPGEEEPPGGD